MRSLRRPFDRRIGENLVLLHPRFVLVLLVDVLDRAFADQAARQNHDPDEPARPVGGGLREDRLGPALVPGAARPVGGRAAVGIDADAALDQAADARPLVAVPVGAAAWRKADAVAAQQELALRPGGRAGGRRFVRGG